MRLGTLLAAADLPRAGIRILDTRGDLGDLEVTDITADSTAVTPGALFCCVPGSRFDGHDFAPSAVVAGSAALLTERLLDLPAGQVVVSSVRASLGWLADAFHGHPSGRLTVAGVTGTNGKTTTVALLAAMLAQAGQKAATIGTLTGTRTTPEAPVLQAGLARLVDGGVTAVAMEVSSHALEQHRVDGVHFSAATFTNLTQDHLDFHGTMARYFEAKARLFEPSRTDVAVVNVDDPWGRRLVEITDRLGTPTVAYSMADAGGLVVGAEGSSFRWHGHDVRLRLRGRFNVANALAAATTAHHLGIPCEAVVAGLAAVTSVPGRFEAVDEGQAFSVLVDYAHTPDGLVQALGAARELAAGEVVVVFGAGGDRDRAKRPLMGAAASRLADRVVVTSDNPRSEDPGRIIADILGGATGPARVVVEPDRGEAIRTALASARPGDVVLIAGKGHERGQERAGLVVPFDDVEAAREALRALPAVDRVPGQP